MIDPTDSRLFAEIFNRMTYEQKDDVPPPMRIEIGEFMYKNGYRFVFNKWYLQAKPEVKPHD